MPDPAETPPASGNDRFNNAIAIIVALISAFLAVSKIKDDNVVQAIQRAQALTVDSWNQYQAKRMRQFELDLEVQRADALIRDGVLKDTAENRALMDGWRKEIERYKTELKELSDTANGHEADFKRHNETDDLFDFSESFLTLALALLAVAALTRIGWLLGLAAGVGVVGVIFGMAGFLRWGIIRPEWLSMLSRGVSRPASAVRISLPSRPSCPSGQPGAPCRHSSSPNRPATSPAIASRQASASSPFAVTVMVVPCAAPSVRRPMIERPPTVSPQRVTVTSESKRSTVWTNFAEARACRPLRLTIGNSRASAPSGMERRRAILRLGRRIGSRSLAGKHARGDVDVFAAGLLGVQDRLPKALLVAHARELDQHRQIDAGDHLDRAAVHARQREIRGRAPEHVGQDHHAVARY